MGHDRRNDRSRSPKYAAHKKTGHIKEHNHPSSDPEPSDADRRITQRLKDALGLVDIRILDHVVVGHEGFVSFAERGWL
ncbi:JAB domain-containing protein [Halomonas sp. IOP_31]|uniref:JAB domain-containing protein n=1 Tax=Halomonas sp. IOP_31 TaxID=2876584 RepID=UPI002F3F86AA